MRLIPLFLCAVYLPAQIPLQFGQLSSTYLKLTPAQVSSIEANNAAYVQAQSAAGKRIYALNVDISKEIQKPDPDAGVIGAAYRGIEAMCRERQPARDDLIKKNVAVLTDAQRTLLEPLRFGYLKYVLASRARTLLLQPPDPAAVLSGNLLFSGTPFPNASSVADLRIDLAKDLMEFLQLSQDQFDAIVARTKDFEMTLVGQMIWMYDLAELQRRNTLNSPEAAGQQAIELELIRRRLAEQAANAVKSNLESLDANQRARLDSIFAITAVQAVSLSMEAENAYLVPTDESRPDRPATFASYVVTLPAGIASAPVSSGLLYSLGNAFAETYFALRSCTAGPSY